MSFEDRLKKLRGRALEEAPAVVDWIEALLQGENKERVDYDDALRKAMDDLLAACDTVTVGMRAWHDSDYSDGSPTFCVQLVLKNGVYTKAARDDRTAYELVSKAKEVVRRAFPSSVQVRLSVAEVSDIPMLNDPKYRQPDFKIGTA